MPDSISVYKGTITAANLISSSYYDYKPSSDGSYADVTFYAAVLNDTSITSLTIVGTAVGSNYDAVLAGTDAKYYEIDSYGSTGKSFEISVKSSYRSSYVVPAFVRLKTSNSTSAAYLDGSQYEYEDGILTISKGGIIYTPGSAGTFQEIFQDAAQNHYETLGYASPMIFLGKKYYTEETPIYPLLEDLQARGKYNNLILKITDETDDVIRSLMDFHRPYHQWSGQSSEY